MAKKLSSNDVRMWRQRLRLSEAWRKQYHDQWRRNIGYLKGKFRDTASDDDYIAVNLVHPMVKVIIPSIYSKNPDILVRPRKKEATEAANLMQNYLRYLFKEIGIKEEMKLDLLDALLCGHGWMKTGFSTGYEEVEEGTQTLISKFLEMVGVTKPSDKEQSEENMERYALQPNEKVVDERPWALRTSPFNMFVPAYSQRPEELPWIAERTFMPMLDVENHPTWDIPKNIYPSTDIRKLIELRSGSVAGLTLSDININDSDLNFKIFYEIYDLREGCIYVISDNDDNCYDWNENIYDFLDSRHPYLMLRFNDVPDEFYPMSDVEPWEPQMHELNETRSQMLNHRKRYNRRYIYNREAFEPEDIEKLKVGADGTMIPTSEENIPSIFLPIQDAPLPPDVYREEMSIKQDITEISGITGYQKGNTAQGAKSATEAAIVESQSRNRNDERLDVVTTFANRLAKNLAQMSQKFMTKEMVFPILGEDAIAWVQIPDSNAIKGDFLYETAYGSSMSINPDVDRQQFIEFYQTAANDPYFDPIKLRLEMVRKYRLPAAESFLNMQVAEQIKQKRIFDALNTPTPGTKGSQGESLPGGSESTPGPEVSDSASIKNSIDQQVAVPTPGGIGGGALETV